MEWGKNDATTVLGLDLATLVFALLENNDHVKKSDYLVEENGLVEAVCLFFRGQESKEGVRSSRLLAIPATPAKALDM